MMMLYESFACMGRPTDSAHGDEYRTLKIGLKESLLLKVIRLAEGYMLCEWTSIGAGMRDMLCSASVIFLCS
jgi:hypothetical protein